MCYKDVDKEMKEMYTKRKNETRFKIKEKYTKRKNERRFKIKEMFTKRKKKRKTVKKMVVVYLKTWERLRF